jgi:hypothetical protein
MAKIPNEMLCSTWIEVNNAAPGNVVTTSFLENFLVHKQLLSLREPKKRTRKTAGGTPKRHVKSPGDDEEYMARSSSTPRMPVSQPLVNNITHSHSDLTLSHNALNMNSHSQHTEVHEIHALPSHYDATPYYHQQTYQPSYSYPQHPHEALQMHHSTMHHHSNFSHRPPHAEDGRLLMSLMGQSDQPMLQYHGQAHGEIKELGEDVSL